MSSSLPPDPEPDAESGYTLDIVATVCGLTSQTILHYHEEGLIHPAAGGRPDTYQFDEATVHRLRRIERLRNAYGLSLPALKLTLDLMDEVERLRGELRARR
jgi:DNA-binding transcriptional MerR regulator